MNILALITSSLLLFTILPPGLIAPGYTLPVSRGMMAPGLAVAESESGALEPADVELGLRQVLFGHFQSDWDTADGGHIIRFARHVTLVMSHRLDPESLSQNAWVEDPSGPVDGWTLEVDAERLIFRPPGVLEPSTTYTFEVRGGPEGLLSEDGLWLEADLAVHLTTDDSPFMLLEAQAHGSDPPAPIQHGGLLPRNATGVGLIFSHPVDPETVAGKIQVVREDGSDAGWQVVEVSLRHVLLDFPDRLPREVQNYTIRVAGGEEGLLNVAGEPLAEDVAFILRTNDQVAYFRYELESNWDRYGVVQSDLYRLTGEEALAIELRGSAPMTGGILLLDDDGQPLFDAYPRGIHDEYAPRLPAVGEYSLLVLENRTTRISLRGGELLMETETPALRFPEMAPFETRNEAFLLEPALLNPGVTGRVTVFLGHLVLAEDIRGAEGGLTPVEVDTTSLEDGIYGLTVAGYAAGSGNMSWVGTPVLVDRVDTFSDVPPHHWARRYIEVMHHLEVIHGRDDGRYDPQAPVTRAEFAKLLAETLGLEAGPETENPFADTEGHWALPYILALWDYGLAVGDVVDGQRYFYPNSSIRRSEAATLIGRVLEVSELPVEGEPFDDWAAVPDWARSSVAALAEMGWLNGFPDGTFQPHWQMQRDQAAKLMAQFFGM
jgi:hypothetical protein